jgi:hypothetical protein
VHLGEFSHRNATLIVEALEGAGIACWTKNPTSLTRIWQLGVEVFVDRSRIDEARRIAVDIVEQGR